MIKTQGTVSMDTSFIFVVFQWRGKVKSMKSVVLSTTEAEYVAVSASGQGDQVFVPNAKEHGDQGTTTYQGSSG